MYDTTVLSEHVEYMGPNIISTLKELNISTEVYEDLVIVLHGLQGTHIHIDCTEDTAKLPTHTIASYPPAVVLPVSPLASFVFCLIILVHMVSSF